jgi:hypothetical protein
MEVMIMNAGTDWFVCINAKGAKNTQIIVTEEKAKRIIAELDLKKSAIEEIEVPGRLVFFHK